MYIIYAYMFILYYIFGYFFNNIKKLFDCSQIFLLLLMLLYLASYALITRFRRKDREDLFSTDEDEVLVYRIRYVMHIHMYNRLQMTIIL